MRFDDLAAVGVGYADDGAFAYVDMCQQRRLDLRPRYVVAGRDDHVVRTRGEMEVARLVLHEGIAGEVPAVAHIGALACVGEVAAAGRAAHGQPADRAARPLVHVLVDDPGFVAAHPLAGRTRPQGLATV